MLKFTGNLLIIDGDAENRELLRQSLAERGFNVSCAADGIEALDCIKANPADIALLNADMPDAAGIEVLKELRNTFTSSQLPVIAATEKTGDSGAVAELLDAGANDYVSRPMDFPVVLASIQTQLERKRTEEVLRKTEELHTLALGAANGGLWNWDLKTGEIYFSPKWKSMIGEEESAVGDNPDEWFSRIHPEDVERVRTDIQAHIDGMTPHYENEYRILHRNGDYLWMLGRGLALRDKTGKAYRMVGWQTDITRSKLTDFLTGLPNRAFFTDRLAHSFKKVRAERTRTLALIHLDLDNFKLINDNLGYTVGDQLLAAIARRLENTVYSDKSSMLRERHTLARLGGDEFIVLMDNVANPIDVINVAKKILADIGESFNVQGNELFPTVSIGIAFYNNTYQTPGALLQDADIAMHHAKLAGKGRFEIFDANMRAASGNRLKLEVEFRQAIERKEFESYYQAVVSMKTGRIFGFEALARWRNPVRGLVHPMEFIPMAEETGLIIPLGHYMLETACRQACEWQSRFAEDPPLSVSVNLSARNFLQGDLLAYCYALLKDMSLARNSLVLEVTESTLLQDYNASVKLMSRLRDMGIRISMDDFGTGYSSLSYLRKFPFNSLKIDQSFISRFDEDREIIRTILLMGHALGMKVVAEGVETPKQVDELRSLDCDYCQGYYFSKPVPAQEATALLEKQDGDPLTPPLEQ